MEYFDFDEAAGGNDDVASDCPEIDEDDVQEKYDSLGFDSKDIGSTEAATLEKPSTPAKGFGDTGASSWNEVHPLHRAKDPCDLCESRGLDCFVAQKGALQNGCTCCISLYKQCSFTHGKPQGKFLATLHAVCEDSCVQTGSLTGKRALKSLGSGNNNFQHTEPQQRKNGGRLSKEASRILKTWISKHSSHPYPTEQEKDQLKQETGLKRSQICNWLANARRRGKVKPLLSETNPGASILPGPVDIPQQGETSNGVDMADLTPFERWKYSPPENEPALATDIIRAMATTSFDASKNTPSSGHVRSHSRRTGSSNGDSSHSNVRVAPSLSSHSLNTNDSSLTDMSFASAFSHRSSHASYNSLDTKDRRRRRHKATAVKSSATQKSRSSRIFQCTFCADSFATKYDWQRHEKSLHLALDRWTCTPHGGIIASKDRMVCAFCRHPDPDSDHLESHNFHACQEKGFSERTFYRKDHLNQHLRLMHGSKYAAWMDDWKSTTNYIRSRCGICSTTFTTWKDRVDHISSHFKAGADMSEWKGDWGFEPHIYKLVDNAIPPYLIGQEKRTMNPWVAQDVNYQVKDMDVEPQSNALYEIGALRNKSCSRRLEIELSAYIARHVTHGMIPTDAMLQDKARAIIYESNDPWNQTYADNPVWLANLKRNNGIGGFVPPQNYSTMETRPSLALGGDSQSSSEANSFGQARPFGATGIHNTGFRTPSIRSSAYNSRAPSLHGSLVGSAVGSADLSPSVLNPGMVSDRAGSPSALYTSYTPPSITTGSGLAPHSALESGSHYNLHNIPGDIQQGINNANLQTLGSNDGPDIDEIIRTSITDRSMPVSGLEPMSFSASGPIPSFDEPETFIGNPDAFMLPFQDQRKA